MPPIILASASPRRRELLALAGVEFTVRPGSALEVPHPDEAPAAFARRMSAEKAQAAVGGQPGSGSENLFGSVGVWECGGVEANSHTPTPPHAHTELGDGWPVVVAADTIVVLGDEIIGKPGDAAEARALLRRLRGREHRVLTGLTVLDTASGAAYGDLVEARVPMRAYDDAELEAYVATGDPLDKAGAYAIQHPTFQPVDLARFEGCAANVMGLPVCAALRLLARAGVHAALEGPRGDCHAFDSARCPLVGRLFVNGWNG